MDAAEIVRNSLIEAFTNGRQRIPKPVVLPVVDRKGHANAPDLIVEDLELCSEPNHPHGQGWVPIRIMYLPTTATTLSSTIGGNDGKVPLLEGQATQSPVQYSSQQNSKPSLPPATSAGVAAALRSTMQITDSSTAAAFKVANPSQADNAQSKEQSEQGGGLPDSKDLLSQSELDELALAGRTQNQEVATQAAHNLLNAASPNTQPQLPPSLQQPQTQAAQCLLNNVNAGSQPLSLPLPQQQRTTADASMNELHGTEQSGFTAGVNMSWQDVHDQQQGGVDTLQGYGTMNVLSTKRRPVVILLHSTGSNMDRMRSEQEACARVGYLAVTMDCRYHGYRCVLEYEGQNRRDVYQQALVRAWRSHGKERPFLLDNLWDLSHLLDYLVTRPDVDPQRIGMTGVSLGGMHAWLMAAADPRVAVAAPMIGVQNFHWAIRHNQWHARVDSVPAVFAAAAQDMGKACVDSEVVAAVWDRIAPGLIGAYDSPCSLAAIYPRPLLIVNGELDMRCPMKGVHEAFQSAQHSYLEQSLKEQRYSIPAGALKKQEGEEDSGSEQWTALAVNEGNVAEAPAGDEPAVLSVSEYGNMQGDGDMPEIPVPAEVVQGGDVSNHHSHNLGEKFLQSCPGGTEACMSTVIDTVERGRNGCETGVSGEERQGNNDGYMTLPEAPIDVYNQAVQAVNEKLILYVEPGAGHEEKAGMWKAVRWFLDLHLRCVDTSATARNAVTVHSHPLQALKQPNDAIY